MRKRFLAMLLCLCMVVTLLPTTAFASGTDTGKAIQLVNSGTAANISGGQAGSIYFGTYQQSHVAWGRYNIDPIKWRVLSNADGKLFLLSDQTLDAFKYHSNLESVTWGTSTMRSWLNGYDASSNTGGNDGMDYSTDNFVDTAFSEKEQGSIFTTTVINADNPSYSTEGGIDTRDKVFLLSLAEATNTAYGFTDSNSDTDTRKATNTAYVANGGKSGTNQMRGAGVADRWWLRSPGDDAHDAALVLGKGSVADSGAYVSNAYGVRPAFNLNLNSVLFTSAAAGGKNGTLGTVSEIPTTTTSEWKLTLKDSSRNFAVTETAATAPPGGTVTLNYTGATTGENEYLSVMIVNSTGAAPHYGRVTQPANESGEVDVTIPAGLADGSYTLKVFNEQYNGSANDDTKKTDYASAFDEVALTVGNTPAPIDASVTPTTANYDKYTATSGLTFTLSPGSYSLSAIKNGETALTTGMSARRLAVP